MRPGWRIWCCVALGLASSAALGRDASWTDPVTGLVFVSIPKSCFQMGTAEAVSPSGSLGWRRIGTRVSLSADEAPRHRVCLDAFWVAKHEVRQSDWSKVMGTGDPPPGSVDRPVSGVSWEQAREFAARLTRLAEKTRVYRLPTEAEWEAVCRAGREESKDAPLAELVGEAWFGGTGRSLFEPSPVGTLKPNALGVHDLLGNVWEWVEDAYRADAYTRHDLFNPVVAGNGRQRVIRGGSYRSEVSQMRCANRSFYDRSETLPQIGFRLVMTGAAGAVRETK